MKSLLLFVLNRIWRYFCDEFILCAAIYVDDGVPVTHQPVDTGIVFSGWRHYTIFGQREFGFIRHGTQGFLTSTGRFVDREEAMRIAIAAGQTREDLMIMPHVGLDSGDLYER